MNKPKVVIIGAGKSSDQFIRRVTAMALAQGLGCVAIIRRLDSKINNPDSKDEEMILELKKNPPMVLPPEKKVNKIPLGRRSIKPTKINPHGSFGRY